MSRICHVQVMRDHPTFSEYLLDRNTEKEKEGCELKYNVISALVASQTSGVVFSPAYLMKLKVSF